MMPVRQAQRAKHFKRTMSGGYIPCAPSDPHAEKMTLMDIKDPSLARVPDVSKEHFYEALSKVKTSVGEVDLDRQVKWTEEFGQDG